MAGGLLFYFNRERRAVEQKQIASVKTWPPISILVPCYNEAANAEETLSAALSVDYPDFEVVAINDGSRDDTAAILDRLAGQWPKSAGRPSRAKSRQGRGAQHGRPACEARAARLHRRRRAARSAGAALGGAHVPAQHGRRHHRQSAHPQSQLAAGAPAGGGVLVDHRAHPAIPDHGRPGLYRVRRPLRVSQVRPGRGRMVVGPHAHRGHRHDLARSACRLARRLRTARDRLDPDAGDAAGPVEAAAALGAGRLADDAGLLQAGDGRAAAQRCCRRTSTSC